MPSVQLYGRRWHFSTDIVAVPAALSGLFHASWILILLVWAGAKGAWPGRCASGDGVQYAVVLGGLLGSFAANLVLDALLVWHSLQGAPFEASKRRWVVPLLYAATAPLVAQLAFAAYGSHVSTQLTPDCWPDDQRNAGAQGGYPKSARDNGAEGIANNICAALPQPDPPAVTNLTQAVVFATWGFMFVAALGIAITYNMWVQASSARQLQTAVTLAFQPVNDSFRPQKWAIAEPISLPLSPGRAGILSTTTSTPGRHAASALPPCCAATTTWCGGQMASDHRCKISRS
jgi:hypothetical protein